MVYFKQSMFTPSSQCLHQVCGSTMSILDRKEYYFERYKKTLFQDMIVAPLISLRQTLAAVSSFCVHAVLG